MLPIEVTWQPVSSNASIERGIWVDTVSMPSKSYTDGTWEHKAVVVSFERNTVHIVSMNMVRGLDGFAWDDDQADPPASPRPINLYGRRVVTGRSGDTAGETGT